MFNKILIANRGEIACRVIRTARRLGLRTIAVFSEADAHALHVRMADAAFPIGGARATESYLRADRILEAARAGGAEAIHPGYGFLSENAAFAQSVIDAGLDRFVPRCRGEVIALRHEFAGSDQAQVAGHHLSGRTIDARRGDRLDREDLDRKGRFRR